MLYVSVLGVAFCASVIGVMVSRGVVGNEGTSVRMEGESPEECNEKDMDYEEGREE